MYRIIGADAREYGPITAEQLRAWIAEGRANADTRVAVEGSAEWKTLGSLPEFSFYLASQAAGAAQPLVRRNNSLAVAGMIMGILSLVFCLCCYGMPFNLLGVIFSLMGLSQIKRQPELYDGKGMAIAGLVLSLLSIVLAVLFLILGITMNWNDLKASTHKL